MKRILLLVLVFFSSLSLFSQVERNELGFRITPNLSTYGDFSHPIPGISAELFYSYQLGKSVFIESGLKYAQLNHQYQGPIILPVSPDYPNYFKRKIISEGFIELPLIVKLSLYESSNSRFQTDVLAGYSFGFKVNQFHIDVYSEEMRLRKVDWNERSGYLHAIQVGFDFSYELKNGLKLGLRPQVRIMQGFSWYEPSTQFVPGVGLSVYQAFGKKTEFKIKEE